VRTRRTVSFPAAVAIVLAAACIPYDFDADGKADYGYLDEDGAVWVLGEASPIFDAPEGGWFVPGDWDGDLVHEPAVVGEASGLWHVAGESTPRAFGPEDVEPGTACEYWIPVPGDWDTSDRHWEMAWYQECDAIWYVQGLQPVQFGVGAGDPQWCCPTVVQDLWYDVPVPGDYDGDGAWEPAVYRVLDGTFRTRDDGVIADFGELGFPAPADYHAAPGLEPALMAPFEAAYLVDGAAPIVFDRRSPVGSAFPTAADHDGNGRAEPTFWNYDTGSFWSADEVETPFPDAAGPHLPVTMSPSAVQSLIRLTFTLKLCWETVDAEPSDEAACPPGVDPPPDLG
jgi:hypothetical protein